MQNIPHYTKKSAIYIVAAVALLFSVEAAATGSFGRFFTTPKERRQIDDLRAVGPEVKINITEEELRVDEGAEKAKEESEALTVKGLVYRSSGKNTAWVNESNTYEGDLSSQYITIREAGVEKNAVVIDLQGNKTDIKLRVGQKYNPETRSILDIADESKELLRDLVDAVKKPLDK